MTATTTPRTSAQLSPATLSAIDIADIGTDALDWLEAVLYAIGQLHETDEAFRIRYLASLGRFIATDAGERIAHERDQLAGGQS